MSGYNVLKSLDLRHWQKIVSNQANVVTSIRVPGSWIGDRCWTSLWSTPARVWRWRVQWSAWCWDCPWMCLGVYPIQGPGVDPVGD